MTVTYKSGQSEKEETPMTLLASVSANRFEDVKPTPFGGSGRRAMAIREMLQRGN
jgi:hypothetical protein